MRRDRIVRCSVSDAPLDATNGGAQPDAVVAVPVGESLWIGSTTPTGTKALSSRLFPPTQMMLLVMQPLPALRTTCVQWGGLFDTAGAVRGAYRVEYHVTNSKGTKECNAARRIVVVTPASANQTRERD